MPVKLCQSPYKEIRNIHNFVPKQFNGNEPRPETPSWNHGDGAPDWANSGWVYEGILYPCAYDSIEGGVLFKGINHQYTIDFEVWADARIALLEAQIKALKLAV